MVTVPGVRSQAYPPPSLLWHGRTTSQSIPRYTLASHTTLPKVLSWQSQKLSQTKNPIICLFSIFLNQKKKITFNVFTLYNKATLQFILV